jgi:4-hydroxybenzoate polyprenyltransferase
MPDKSRSLISEIIYKILDHIFVLRLMLIIPVWTVLLLGFYHSGNGLPFSGKMLWIALAATGLSGAVFILNQIFDIESDRINDKVYFLPKGYVKIGTAWVMFTALNILSILVSFLISPTVGLIGLSILILGVAYSMPPFVIKDRPWPGFLANAFGHGTLVFLLGYCALGGKLLPGLIKSLPYFLSVSAVYIGTTLADIEGDKRTGKKTLAVIWGMNRSVYFLVGCYFVSLLAAFYVMDKPFLWAALAVAPFYIWTAIAKHIRSALMALKISIVTLSLASAYYYPVYLIFLLALILFTRIYYDKRFGIKYPSLG